MQQAAALRWLAWWPHWLTVYYCVAAPLTFVFLEYLTRTKCTRRRAWSSRAAEELLTSAEEPAAEDPADGVKLQRTLSSFRRLPRRAATNPMVSPTWRVEFAERLQIAICAPLLLPLRVLLLLASVLFAVVWCNLAVLGWPLNLKTLPDGKKCILPDLRVLPWWRRVLRWPGTLGVRGLLFALGFVWVETEGSIDPEARVVAGNHVSMIEPLLLGSLSRGTAVSAAENVKIPLFGPLVRAFQPIHVDRVDVGSRKLVAATIVERAQDAQQVGWPPVLIFPEGTTTSGRQLICFKAGGFGPGVPVQLCCVTFPPMPLMLSSFDPCWVPGGPGLGEVFGRLLCQPINRVRVEFLPLYTPSEAEKKDARLFARNARARMAEHMGLPVTEHSFDDVALSMTAARLNEPPQAAAVELNTLRKIVDVSRDQARKYLEEFAAGDTSGDGRLDFGEFCAVFGQNAGSEEVRRLFSLLDEQDDGFIDFREYLVGLALLDAKGSGEDAVGDSVRLAWKTMSTPREHTVFGEEAGLDRSGLRKVLVRAYPDVSEETVKRLFAEADADGSGIISMAEFVAFAKANEEQMPVFRQAFFRQGSAPAQQQQQQPEKEAKKRV